MSTLDHTTRQKHAAKQDLKEVENFSTPEKAKASRHLESIRVLFQPNAERAIRRLN